MGKQENQTEENNESDKFAKLSVLFSLITLVLVVKVFSYFPTVLKLTDGFPEMPQHWVILTTLSCIIGMICTVFSFRNKEENVILKWLGAIVNVQFFVIILSAFLLF